MLSNFARASGLRYFSPANSGPMDELVRTFLPPATFYNQMLERGFDFFTGVPDSLLKDFCGYIHDNHPAHKHIITANEGSAIAVAAGYHMGSRKFPVVYLQNSGLGNIVNPLLSLVDQRVYSIPMLLMIGWRGEPGRKDEPQHMVQGKVMNSMLADIGCTYEVLPDYEEGASAALDAAYYHLQKRNAPYAFLVRKRCFEEYDIKEFYSLDYEMCREDAIDELTNLIGKFDPVVATTGFPSRELYEQRVKKGMQTWQDFYCVGSMGHASSIAMGLALAKPSKSVICLDGDGAFIMHMGAAAQIGPRVLPNFKHILLNNGAHDSVGGQPTVGANIDFAEIARACGYKFVGVATTKQELIDEYRNMQNTEGPGFLEIKLKRSTRSNLGRPKQEPRKSKEEFMRFVNQ